MIYKMESALNYSINNVSSTLEEGEYRYSISFKANGHQYVMKNIPDIVTIGKLYRMIIEFVSKPDEYGYEIDARYIREINND